MPRTRLADLLKSTRDVGGRGHASLGQPCNAWSAGIVVSAPFVTGHQCDSRSPAADERRSFAQPVVPWRPTVHHAGESPRHVSNNGKSLELFTD